MIWQAAAIGSDTGVRKLVANRAISVAAVAVAAAAVAPIVVVGTVAMVVGIAVAAESRPASKRATSDESALFEGDGDFEVGRRRLSALQFG